MVSLRKINILVYITFLITSILIYYGVINLGIKNGLIFLDSAALLLILYHLYITHKEYRILRMSSIFLIAFFIVHFQYYIDFLLGFNDFDNSYYPISDMNVYLRAAALSSMALYAFLIGYNLYKPKRKVLYCNYDRYYVRNYSFMNMLTVALIVLYYFSINKSYLNRGYASFEPGFWAVQFSKFATMNIYALVIAKYLSVSKVKSFFRFYRLELILAVFLVSPSLIAGDRGAFISFILFFCGVFFLKTKKKLNVPALVIVGFSLAFVISILGIRRQGNSLNESVKIFSSKGKSISNATYELSGSVQSLLIALDNIPNVYPHLYGLTMADELLLLVPGATDFVLNLLSVPPQMRFSPQYLTFIALGPKSSWGVGSTCVADVYVNFGSLGVPIIFFLFGIMCYIIDNASLKRNLKPAMLIFVLIAYSYSVYISRATLLTTITGFIYVYLIYTVFLKRTVNNNIKNASI